MRKAVNHLKKSDPVLAAMIERVGPCKLQVHPPEFGRLVSSIVHQQLNGKAAKSILERFVGLLPEGGLTPENVLALTPEAMRAAGLSKGKTLYIRDLAEKTGSGAVDFSTIGERTDEDAIGHLTQVKGIGVWTAHMFLIFAMGRPDVLPVGDLGIRTAMGKAYELAELPKPAQMEEIAAPWRPYRSVAAWYLWRSLDGEAGI